MNTRRLYHGPVRRFMQGVASFFVKVNKMLDFAKNIDKGAVFHMADDIFRCRLRLPVRQRYNRKEKYYGGTYRHDAAID